jgi:hypothetical protein
MTSGVAIVWEAYFLNGHARMVLNEESYLIPTLLRWIIVGILTRPSILRFPMTENYLQPAGAGLGRGFILQLR